MTPSDTTSIDADSLGIAPFLSVWQHGYCALECTEWNHHRCTSSDTTGINKDSHLIFTSVMENLGTAITILVCDFDVNHVISFLDCCLARTTEGMILART
jgi:hypothetical protein